MALILLDKDIWEASLLDSIKDEPMASPIPTKEGLPLCEDLEPQVAQASAPHNPIWPEEAPKPDDAVG